MNQKEVGELRRRLRPGKNNFSHVYGCYVSPLKEIIAEVDQPLSLLNEDDVESCLALLRKALSGGLGRNLVDVAFSTRQVAESEELKRLLALRDAKLKDAAARREFYETVIQNLELGEDSYLILLAQESYDVPFRTRNDEVLDDSSDTVYSYLLCAVCPMREGKPGLGYVPNENALHVKTAGRLASPPEVGFLWPAFDDRAPNLYNALYYVRKPELLHGEFISGVFGTEPPLSAARENMIPTIVPAESTRRQLTGEKSMPMIWTAPNRTEGRRTAAVGPHFALIKWRMTPLKTISSTNPAAMPVKNTPAQMAANISPPVISDLTNPPGRSR